MIYYFTKKLDLDFNSSIAKVTDELKNEGFGIITEIDVKNTLKNKLNVDFRNYKILGACNPEFAYKALQEENKIGLLLPCNVIIQEIDEGNIEVSIIDPIVSMSHIANLNLEEVAKKIRMKLQNVIDKL